MQKEYPTVRFKCSTLDMTFWKANIDIEPLRGILSRLNLDDYRTTMEGLGTPSQPIMELWGIQPPERHLHIIVEIPAEGRRPAGTSQIPQIGLAFVCLLVKNDGTPLGYPIVLRQTEDRLVSQLAESIKQESCDIPPDVHLSCIDLWKPDPPLPPRGSELLRAANGLHLNELGNERNVTPAAGKNPPT